MKRRVIDVKVTIYDHENDNDLRQRVIGALEGYIRRLKSHAYPVAGTLVGRDYTVDYVVYEPIQ